MAPLETGNDTGVRTFAGRLILKNLDIVEVFFVRWLRWHRLNPRAKQAKGLTMHVRLIDANSLGNPHPLTPLTPDTWGAVDRLRRFLQAAPQVLNVLLWDGRAAWRRAQMPDYGEPAHRATAQGEALAQLCQRLPVPQVTHPGAEAADLAWGLSRQLERQGHRVTLYTNQPQWLQLVSSRTGWTSARKSGLVELDGFARSSGGFPRPGAVADVLALSGDADRQLVGLPDFNVKKALALVSRFGSVQGALDAASDFMAFSAEPAHHLALMVDEHRTRVARNLALLDLSRGPALDGALAALTLGEYCELGLFELFMDLDFRAGQADFEAWSRGLDKRPDKPALQAFARSVASMAESWQPLAT